MENIEPQPTPIIPETPIISEPSLKPAESLPKPKNNRFLIVIIAILFVAVLYLLYLNFNKPSTTATSLPKTGIITTETVSPTTNPTADWKTYTNTAFNYTVKYPSSWTIGVEGNADPKTFFEPSLDSPCNNQAGDVCSSMMISVQKPYGTIQTLDDYANNLTNTRTLDSPRLISKKQTTINGQDSIEIEIYQDNYFYSSTDHGVVRIDIVTLKNNEFYIFDLLERRQDQNSIKTSNDWKNKDVYYQILSTFKFI